MYLSRLVLNPMSRDVRRDLADCQFLHRTVMSAFPSVPGGRDARASLGVLHRLDVQRATGKLTLLVQSDLEPNWLALRPGYLRQMEGTVKNPDFKPVDHYYDRVKAGMILMFRLRANPTRKVETRTGPDGRRQNGKRVELRGEAAYHEWLRRKAEESGFSLVTVRASSKVPDVLAVSGNKVTGGRQGNPESGANGSHRRLTFAAVTFDGVLRVSDRDRFRKALRTGIGPAKAYGFGLLSIAPRRGQAV